MLPRGAQPQEIDRVLRRTVVCNSIARFDSWTFDPLHDSSYFLSHHLHSLVLFLSTKLHSHALLYRHFLEGISQSPYAHGER